MSFFNERLKCLRGNTLSRNSFLKAKEEQTILDASFPNSYLKIEIKFNRFTMPVLMNQVGPNKEVPDHGVLLWCLHVILFQDSNQNGIGIYTDGSRDKNKVAASAVINEDVCFLLDSQMRRLNFFIRSKAIEIAFEHIDIYNIYFQIHFPVYSFFIV